MYEILRQKFPEITKLSQKLLHWNYGQEQLKPWTICHLQCLQQASPDIKPLIPVQNCLAFYAFEFMHTKEEGGKRQWLVIIISNTTQS